MKVYICPHWHFDHAWIKSHEQYMKELVIPSFKVLLRILSKYPNYRIAVEQASQWISLKKLEPELFEQIKSYVKNGNISCVGGQITSPDINIPNGESLLRNYFYGKRYLHTEFGTDTDIAWNVDLFGHTSQYPLILSHMGMKYYVFHRGVDDKKFRSDLKNGKKRAKAKPPNVLFHWVDLKHESPILTYYQTNTYTASSFDPVQLYNQAYFADVLFHGTMLKKLIDAAVKMGISLWFLGNKLSTRSALKIVSSALISLIYIQPYIKLKEIPMLLTTMGSDFTAPSSFILSLMSYLTEWGNKHHVAIKIAHPSQFFHDAEKIEIKKTNTQYPKYQSYPNYQSYPKYQSAFRDMGRIFSGVWSTRIKLKQENRNCERELYDIEALSSMITLYSHEKGLEMEYPHEIIDDLWNTCLTNQFHDISCGCCIDLVYLNAIEQYRDFRVKAKDLKDRLLNNFAKEINTESFVNKITGFTNLVVFFNQLPWNRDIEYRERLIKDIPALGYKVILVDNVLESPKTSKLDEVSVDYLNNLNYLLPNSEHQFGNFKIVIKDGKIEEIFDVGIEKSLFKRSGRNWIGRIRLLKEKGDSYDSRTIDIQDEFNILGIKLVHDTKTETTLQLNGIFDGGNTIIKELLEIRHLTHEIILKIQIANSIRNAKFELCLPHAPELKKCVVSMPFGSQKNPKGVLPVQGWISFTNDTYGLCIINHGTPEHIYYAPNCYITLIRGFEQIGTISVFVPRKEILGLEIGTYNFEFSIKSVLMKDGINFENLAMEILHPCLTKEIQIQAGKLESQGSILEIPKDVISVSAIKFAHPIQNSPTKTQNTELILRLYNAFQFEQNLKLLLLTKFKSIEELNGMEQVIHSEKNNVTIDSNAIGLTFKPYDLKTFKLVLL